jgi:hypothetical protein
MTDVPTLVDAYFDAWTTTDPDQRHALVADIFARCRSPCRTGRRELYWLSSTVFLSALTRRDVRSKRGATLGPNASRMQCFYCSWLVNTRPTR